MRVVAGSSRCQGWGGWYPKHTFGPVRVGADYDFPPHFQVLRGAAPPLISQFEKNSYILRGRAPQRFFISLF